MHFSAPNAGADADQRRKYPRKVALIGKPGRYCDLRKQQATDGHQLLGGVDALAKEPLMWRQADGRPKRSRKMANREIQLSRDFLQRWFSAEVRCKPFAGPLHLPRRKAAAHRFGIVQSAIGLSDMRCERQHHVIDEKLVRFGWPAQSLQERCADVMHSVVVKAVTELTVELADTPRAEPLRDAVERQGGT